MGNDASAGQGARRSTATRAGARLLGLLAALLAACAPLPERANVPLRWQPSPNFGERRPNLVVLHHTGDDAAQAALRTLTDRDSRVSAHYLIGRDGTVYQLVDERARAWHAGESRWGNLADVNSASLGIELDNDGDEPFPDAQIDALLALLRDIQRRYGLPAANFVGHADVAPRRKTDPSRHFPWKRLAEQGFGLWCEPPDSAPSFDGEAAVALQALGYDAAHPDAALQAFKRHFAPDDESPALTDRDRRMLRCLLEQKR